MKLICWLLGHMFVPHRFQSTPDPNRWAYRCRRCGQPEVQS